MTSRCCGKGYRLRMIHEQMNEKDRIGKAATAQTVTYQAPDVTRRIWGSADAIMLIFAGSAAEFAVNKAVDWLFWTNLLPSAPIERFFETVRFAQAMMFGDDQTVAVAIAAVNGAHRGVERKRGERIPAWAYRDVLFMLVDYGERAHYIVYGPMSVGERQAHFEAAVEIGRAMHIEELPTTYAAYQEQRQTHLRDNTAHGPFTDQLYARYREHLGPWRMKALLDVQASLVPERVRQLLNLKRHRRVDWLFRSYQRWRSPRILRQLYPIVLPRRFAEQLATLEYRASAVT